MAWGTVLAGIAILGMAVSWYGLQFVALRDLHVRRRVRSGNRVLWALTILSVPYLGALTYLTWGSTTAVPRANRPVTRPTPMVRPRIGADLPMDPLPRAHRPASTPAPGVRRQVVPASRLVAASQRPSPPVGRDPVIGTDMSELLQRRSGITPLSGSADTIIRWPGSGIPPPAPLDLRD